MQTLVRFVLANIGPWRTEPVDISSAKQNFTRTHSLIIYLTGIAKSYTYIILPFIAV